MRVLALDYGAARTGVAVSDASGTLARPVGVVRKAATEDGLAELARLVAEHDAERVVVGLPLTLRGEHGKQAAETQAFVSALEAALPVPVETADERFTTALAQRFGGKAQQDAAAASHLLQGWLDREARR
jgi:putative Holliday junction resolvase